MWGTFLTLINRTKEKYKTLTTEPKQGKIQNTYKYSRNTGFQQVHKDVTMGIRGEGGRGWLTKMKHSGGRGLPCGEIVGD